MSLPAGFFYNNRSVISLFGFLYLIEGLKDII